ncbi:MAG: DUF2225 domain-containing protein [Clostridia bacterium]
METKEMNNLFEDVEDLEPHNLKDEEKHNDEKKDSLEQERIETDFLFDRKFHCPVCNSHITARSVKASSIRILSRDSDFMIHYKNPNPMLYDICVCTECGYAASSSQFNNLSPTQIGLIREKICTKWNPKTYSPIYNLDIAIERYKLALLNSIVKNGKASEKAFLCLRLSWLNRLKNDTENEKKFSQQALENFLQAFEKESFPIAGLDEPSLIYLIGELYRRAEDDNNALLWFSRVLSNRTATNKIKDMARDQKYLMVQEKTESKNNKQITSENDIKQKSGLFHGLFSWSK